MSRRGLLVAVTLAVGLLAGPAGAQKTWLLVVSGLGGEPEFSDAFAEWSTTLVDAAAAAGVPAAQITWLAEDPERDPARIDGRSDREGVTGALARLAEETAATDQLWIVLVGHGSSSGDDHRFNLPGPDLTAADFAAALEPIGARVAFVNAASSSGGFVPFLSGENRAVVTATRSGGQRNETIFGEHFAAAFAGGTADLDKDGRVSLLEAFRYVDQQVARHYEDQGLLVTEHPQLDDNADRVASREPDPMAADEAVDGRLAARLVLAQGAAAAAAASDPELARLLAEKVAVEERIEALRRQRDSLDEDVYFDELESLMVELARTERELESRQRPEPGESRGEVPPEPDATTDDDGESEGSR